MSVLEFESVSKKFKKGEKFNSIRDAFPNFLKKSFKDNSLKNQEFWAVKEVSFQIKKGDVVGIMGPNGAGKSTILKLLSKIIIPTSGRISINGRLSALIEVTAGFHPDLTGRENVYLNGTILGMRRKEIDAKFDEIVEFSGITEFIDTPVKRYSSGMYSRLGFSVAAHMDPEILLVDEVLAVGDLAFQAKCAQKMREMLHSGATIVLVSHQLNMIQSLCKRVILLQHGQIIRDGKVDEVIPHYQNIVFKKSEDEVKHKIAADNRVKVDTSALVDIPQVYFLDEQGKAVSKHSVGDSLTIQMDYSARQPVESPIFLLEIVRSDGVLCCSLRSDEGGLKVESIQGVGSIVMHLGKIVLCPGIYMIKLAIWDREMVHPYVVRNKDIIRIESAQLKGSSDAVFIPECEWQKK